MQSFWDWLSYWIVSMIVLLKALCCKCRAEMCSNVRFGEGDISGKIWQMSCICYNGLSKTLTQPFLLFSCHSLYCSVSNYFFIGTSMDLYGYSRTGWRDDGMETTTTTTMLTWRCENRWWYVTQNWISIRWSNEF